MKEKVLWTDLTLSEIVVALQEDHRIWVSKHVVRLLLKKHGYRSRKAQKKRTMKEVANRDAQFRNIARLIDEYRETGNPILSIDTKKTEQIGNFYRDGYLYTLEELEVYDHDFSSFSEGKIIPHGLYDVLKNIGYINIGTSRDTTEFACDSIRHWWYTYGQVEYPTATSLLIPCDGGGSNSSRYYIFKEDLQALADEIGIEIRHTCPSAFWDCSLSTILLKMESYRTSFISSCYQSLPRSDFYFCRIGKGIDGENAHKNWALNFCSRY